MSAQVAADLRAAADVLRRDGWTQGRMHCADGHCAAGALEVAVDPDGWTDSDGWDSEQNERYSCALAELRQRFGTLSIARWNDAPERTADEVIAALEATADHAEQHP